MNFLTALRKEWLEQRRTRRLLIVIIVFVAFGLSSPLLAKFMPEMMKSFPETAAFASLFPDPTAADAVGQYLKNMSQFGLLLAVLLSMGAVTNEKERGTAALMLTKPLPRGSFLAAKAVALLITFGVGVALAGLGGYYYTYVLFEPLPVGGWLALNGLLLAYIFVYVAITLLASTLARSQVAAGGIAFGLAILLGIFEAIPTTAKLMPAKLLAWGTQAALGNCETAWGALAVCLGLALAALLGAWLALRKQEL